MKKHGCHIVLMFALFLASAAYGQERRMEMRVYFCVVQTVVDTSYMDNAAHLQEITTALENLQRSSATKITEVSFCGAASPEGNYELNHRLARERLTALERLVRQQVDIPDSVITRNDSYIPWTELKSQLEQSDIKGKEEAIAIIEEESQLVNYHWGGQRIDHRVVKLQQLDGGSVWKQIHKLFFNRLRNAYAIIITYTEQLPPAQEAPTVLVSTQMKPAQLKPHPYPERPEEPEEPEEEQRHRLLHLKTNAVGWGLAITNLAVEVDLGKHWSFTLPVYYSAWDYFKETVKFRTLAIQPEIRYWFSIKNQCNDGWFIGAHFGLAQYNLAAGGDYRYQDYKRKTPAPGGGLSLGYRVPISKNHRWRMEFAVGGGVYSLHFDKYYNTDHTKDGLRVGDERKTYWGFDQAAVTFSYSFDLKKKGGK